MSKEASEQARIRSHILSLAVADLGIILMGGDLVGIAERPWMRDIQPIDPAVVERYRRIIRGLEDYDTEVGDVIWHKFGHPACHSNHINVEGIATNDLVAFTIWEQGGRPTMRDLGNAKIVPRLSTIAYRVGKAFAQRDEVGRRAGTTTLEAHNVFRMLLEGQLELPLLQREE